MSNKERLEEIQLIICEVQRRCLHKPHQLMEDEISETELVKIDALSSIPHVNTTTLTKKKIKTNFGKEVWEKEECYCPVCGTQNVWVESHDGDVYVGPDYVCLNCDVVFHLPDVFSARNSYKTVIRQLKEGS